jgi:hypothetical protein
MEQWKEIPGTDGHYEISNLGNARRSKPGRRTRVGAPVRVHRSQSGYDTIYPYVNGRRMLWAIHRAVASAFLGPAPEGKWLVRHLDGNPRNNHIDNLAWGDPADNRADDIRNGVSFGRRKVA